MRLEKLGGSRFLLTGFVLFVLMLSGFPLPETGTADEMPTSGNDGSRAITSYVPYVPIKQVACGETHSMILKTDGTLWGSGCGDDRYGVLGTGDTDARFNFVRVLTGVKEVACGPFFTMALKTDGTLWATGDNRWGQLGTGDQNGVCNFVQVLSNVKAVACGVGHTLAVRNDSTIWATGMNDAGQLGLGDRNIRLGFVQVPGLSGVKRVVCGYYNSFALKTDNTLRATGASYGTGDLNERLSFVQILDNIRTLACGGNFTLVVKNDSTLWGSGVNRSGQLGTGDPNDRIAFVQVMSNVRGVGCGSLHSLVTKNDNSLWVTGENDEGQHGTGPDDGTFKSSFVKVANNASSAAGGVWHSLLVKTDGSLWVAGDNTQGAIGLGITTSMSTYFQRKVALRSCRNNLYVSPDFDASDEGPLYAKSSSVELWEAFGLSDVTYECDGETRYALHSYANHRFVWAYPGNRACAWNPLVTETEKIKLYVSNLVDQKRASSYSVVYLQYTINSKYLNNDTFDLDQTRPGSASRFYMYNLP